MTLGSKTLSISSAHRQLLDSLSEVGNNISTAVSCSSESFRNTPKNGDGISFLDLKNHIMLDYVTDLTLLCLTKISGEPFESIASRLVEHRILLEKLRPLQNKLKYQISKAINISLQHSSDKAELLAKPRPEQLLTKLAVESSDDDDNGNEDKRGVGKSENSSLYTIPKNIPTHYTDDFQSGREDEKVERRKKTLSRALMDDVRHEMDDTPFEEFLASSSDVVPKSQRVHEMKERIRFEEENFIRLPLTKKIRGRESQRFTTMGNIGDRITDFGSNSFEDGNLGSSKASLKRKKSFTKGRAKKKFR